MTNLTWIRVDCDLATTPKYARAGFEATTVWIALAQVSGQFAYKGRIPPEGYSTEFLSARLRAPAEFIKTGIEKIVACGLMSQDGDDLCFDAADWDRFQNPETSRKREQRFAAKHDSTECPGTVPATRRDGTGPDLTRPDLTEHNATLGGGVLRGDLRLFEGETRATDNRTDTGQGRCSMVGISGPASPGSAAFNKVLKSQISDRATEPEEVRFAKLQADAKRLLAEANNE